MKLTCSCGKEFWPSQRWMLMRCEASHAINVTPAINDYAINKREMQGEKASAISCQEVGCYPVPEKHADIRPTMVGEAKSQNRRKRSDYNAYMREYMRKRRVQK